MGQRYFPAIVALLSGAALGLFAGEVLQKTGHGSIMATLALPAAGAAAVFIVWRLYGRIISDILGVDRRAFQTSDAFSYSPLILTALMLARSWWPVPRLGTLLFLTSALMTVWIKAGLLLAYRKGAAGPGKWTYAVPAGFSIALLVQAARVDSNVAGFAVLGQVFAILIGIGAGFITGRSARTRDS